MSRHLKWICWTIAVIAVNYFFFGVFTHPRHWNEDIVAFGFLDIMWVVFWWRATRKLGKAQTVDELPTRLADLPPGIRRQLEQAPYKEPGWHDEGFDDPA